MDKHFWDSQVDYLKSTRKKMWNDDYFEFLVKTVWKLDNPKNVVDFGCGYGYIGMMLLPLLPEGSSYTGVQDIENCKDTYFLAARSLIISFGTKQQTVRG